MNNNKFHRRFSGLYTGLLAFAVAGAPGLMAQDEDEVFELSPFSVNIADDQGYRATTTLAGTRLRSNLNDLAGAIQIITPEFLEDTAVTGTEDLFLYTTNTEASGPDGNYGGGGAERRNPNSSRVRGLAAPDRTRDYFLSDIGFDTYNTERVAIAKGPNAILFGLGSPAGIVNNRTKQASFEDENRIQLRYGSWGSHREVLDFNRVLIEDKLAVRLVGLNNQTKYKQKPSFSDEQRLYGTISFQATENTMIRANMEVGSIDASRPNTSSPTSNIPTWVADGMPVTTGNYSQTGFSNFGGNRNGQYIYSSPTATTPSVGFDPAPATPGPDKINRHHYTYVNRSEEGNSGFSSGVLTDDNGWIFDYRNRTLSGLDNTQNFSFDAMNITLEQRLGENAGIELSLDDQLYNSLTRDRVGNNINIDASAFLPYFVSDGAGGTTDVTNPNVGRPYVTMTGNMRKNETERNAWRATGYYDLDFAKQSDNSWAGRHVFTGVLSKQTRQILAYSNNYGDPVTGEMQNVLEANRNRSYTASSWDRRSQGKRYLGPRISGRLSGGYAAQGVMTNGTPRLQEFQSVMYDVNAPTISDAHEVANGGRGGAYREVNATVNIDPITSASLDKQVIKSLAITGQSYFFNNNLVATYGWREDDASSRRDGSPTQTADNIALVESLDLNSIEASNTKASVFSWGAVGHLPRNLTENMGVELSVHYGTSENFVPSPGRVTILNQPHPDPAGETTEYGFSVGLMENKLNFRVNWYETISQNQTDRSLGGGSIPNWERLFYNNVRSSLQELEEKVPGDPSQGYWPNNINWADTYTLPPEGMMDVFWTPTRPDPSPGGDNSVSDHPNSQVMGVSDFASKGMEIEGAWNPTNNWTFSFNAAQQEVVKTNVLKSYVEYWNIREPQWVAMGDLVARPNTYKNANPQTIYQRTRTVQWPNLLRQISAEGKPSHEIREWRYNLITNYRFDEDSALKGWSVGGAYRWQDQVGVGFENGFISGADYGAEGMEDVGVADVNKPLFGPSEQNLDIWFAHKRKIMNDSVDWKIQLNIRNALGNDDLIVTAMDADGLPTRVRIMNPMNFRLTSTFKF
jgi:outer membrane receptor protein involved in Fe transport